MKQRTLVILGGAAALSIVSALLLTPDSGVEAPPGAGELAFEGLAARLQDATRIEIGKHDGRLVLERRGGSWVVPDRGGHPVRPERVRELLVGLTEVRLLEPRTADPALHGRLGVDDPSKPGSAGLLVRVQEEDGDPVAELVVGRRRVRTQGNVPETAYVRRPDEAQSWLAEGRLPVDADPQLWLDRDVVNLPASRVRSVAVRRPGEAELVLAREETAEAKLALSGPPGSEAKDEAALDEVARALESVTFLDVKAAGEAPPGAALGESRFALADGPAVVAAVSREGDALWLTLRAEGTGSAEAEAERLNARWRGRAYQVAAWKEKALLPSFADLGARAPAAQASPPPAETMAAPAAPADKTAPSAPTTAGSVASPPAAAPKNAAGAATPAPDAAPKGAAEQAAAPKAAPSAAVPATQEPSSAATVAAPAAEAAPAASDGRSVPGKPAAGSAATPPASAAAAPAAAAADPPAQSGPAALDRATAPTAAAGNAAGNAATPAPGAPAAAGPTAPTGQAAASPASTGQAAPPLAAPTAAATAPETSPAPPPTPSPQSNEAAPATAPAAPSGARDAPAASSAAPPAAQAAAPSSATPPAAAPSEAAAPLVKPSSTAAEQAAAPAKERGSNPNRGNPSRNKESQSSSAAPR